jgi:aspartate carbamoyltransferase catalytic subunit
MKAARRVAPPMSRVPIINAGDGTGQHPTQAFLDMYTILKELGRLDNLSVAVVGDLANGRTVRSLCYLLAKYRNTRIYMVAPEVVRMREDIKSIWRATMSGTGRKTICGPWPERSTCSIKLGFRRSDSGTAPKSTSPLGACMWWIETWLRL